MSPNLAIRSRFNVAFKICFLCLLACEVDVEAQSASFVPARFGADNPLAQIEVSPRDLARRKGSVAIRCQTFVETDGRLTDYYCAPPSLEDQQVTRLVVEALQGQTFVAAQVDGTPVRILMAFAVSIQCAGDSCSIESVQNHGHHTEDLGTAYVAPQPILPDHDWYEGYEDKLEWIRGWMPNVSTRFNQDAWPMRPIIAVGVDVDGIAAKGCIDSMRLMGDDDEQRNRQKLEQALKSIGETRFIPGFHDGRPVAMQFFERAVFQNVARMVSRPPRSHPSVRISNRYFSKPLANRAEAPDLYCAN
jgi:hypothetical protein